MNSINKINVNGTTYGIVDTITTINGKSGVIAASDIAAVLSAAGYKLTDENTVTSINGKTGAIEASDIASVLIEAGYELTSADYVPTLTSAPTGSTLTYTKDNKVYDFVIGQFCRVADAGSNTGYVFYQLYDIIVEGNNSTAVWNETGVPPVERVRVILKSDQISAPNELRNLAVIKITSTKNGIIYNNTVPSDSITLAKVDPDDTYTIEAGNVVGYIAPLSQSFTAEISGLNEAVVNYTDVNLAHSVVTVTDQSYTGSSQTPQPTVMIGSRLISSDNYDVEYSENVNVGTATVTVTGKGVYIGSMSGQFVITKVQPSYTAPTAKSGLIYNGTTQNLVNAGSTEEGTIEYSLDGILWSQSVPQGTNVPGYTVYWRLTGDQNHTDIAEQQISVSIAKVTPTVVAPTAKSLTYNAAAQALVNAGNADFGTIQYSLDGTNFGTEIPTGTNAGDYTVYYRVVGDSNINDVAAQMVSVSIAKAAPSYTAPTAKTLTYDGTEQTLLNAGNTLNGTISYSDDGENWASAIPVGTNATDYTVYWKLEGDSNHTSVASTAINLSIAKVTPTVTAPTAKVLTFNEQAQSLVNAGSVNFGTLKYSLDEETWSTNIPTATNQGSYTVYYKVDGDLNINDVASESVECSINEKQVTATVELSQSVYIYDGTAKTPTVTVKDGQTVIDPLEYNVEYSNNINVGTATVTISDNAGGNYEVIGSTTFIINKVTPVVTAPTAKNLIYNGTEQALANAGSTDFGTLQYSADGESWSTSIPTAVNAGSSYKVYYKVVGDSNVNDVSATFINCSIAKADLNASVSMSSWTYDGISNNPSVSGNSGNGSVSFLYKIKTADDSTYTETKPTNAGTYTIKAIINETSNYNGQVVTGEFTIAKVTPTVTAPIAKSGLVYDGTEHVLADGGSTNYGTLQYSADNENWSANVPSGIAAGSDYKVYYRVIGNSNINDVTSTYIDCVIAKANLFASVSMSGWAYGEQDTSPSVSGNIESGDVSYTYKVKNAADSTYTTTKPSDAGTYVVRAIIDATSNYNGQTVTDEFTIAKADISLSVSIDDWTYGETAPNPSVSGNSGSGLVSYTYKSSGADDSTYAATKPTNVGTYTIRAIAAETINYNSGSATNTFSISKTAPGYTAPTAKSPIYNGNAQALLNAGSTSDGTIQYSADGTSWGTGIPTGTAAGGYTSYWRIIGDANHNDKASASISTTIAKANLSASVSMDGWTYGETAKNPSVSGNSGSGTVTYAYKVKNAADSTYTATKPSNADTYVVRAIIDETSNYNGTTVYGEFTIAKAAPSYTAPTAKSPTYNGSAQALLNAGSTSHGTISYSADGTSWGSSIPTGTNATSYTVYWKLDGDSNHNSVASTSVSVSIGKVTPTVTAPTAKVLTYNGSAQALANAGSTDFGTMKYSLDNSSWSTSMPTGTNQGSYTVYYKVEGDSNVNSVASASIACSINEKKVTATVTLSQTSYTYDGNAKQPGVTVNDGSTVIPSSEYTVSYSNNVNAGTATVTVSDKAGGNYEVIGSATFTISKVTPSVTAPTAKSLIYTGNAQTLANAGSTNYGTLQYSADNSTWGTTIPTGTGASTSYKVYYRVVGNSNVNDVASASINCSIAKATPSYTAPTAKSLTYNGNNQALLNAGSTSHGTIQYSSDNSTWGTSIPTGNGAGSYTTYWRLVGDSNHNDKASTSIGTTIGKASISPSVSMSGWTYGGTASNPSVSGNSGSGSVTYNYKVNGAADSTYTATKPSNAGTYVVRAQIAETSNYYGATVTNTFTISKANLSASVSMSGWTYGGSASSPSVSGNSGSGSVTYNYKVNGAADSTYTSTKPSNAGTYVVRAQIAETSNYNGATVTNTFTISKANLSASVSMSGWTYGGTASSPSVSGNSGGGGVAYAYKVNGAADSTYTSTKPSNAGTYVVRAIIDATTNYNSATVTNTFTISKANISASVSMAGWTYGGTASNPSVSGNSGGGGVTYTYKVSTAGDGTYTSTKPSNAGTYTVRAVIDATTNYNGATVTNTFTIAKASQSAPTATGATVDYGQTATATASGGGGQGSIEWSNGNTRTALGSNTTKARWIGNSNYNASPWSNEVTLTVQKGHAGHDYVEIGGIKWATMNIGANSVTDRGLYFQWGDAQGYTASEVGSGSGQKYFGWEDYKYTNDGGTTITKYNSTDGKTVLDLSDDAARANWGGSWRMPTTAEYAALGNAVNTAWTASYQGSGVAGLVCTAKADSSKVLFFPACGACSRGSVTSAGSFGLYWSSSPIVNYIYRSYYLYSNSGNVNWQSTSNRCDGFSIRGVVG